MINIFIFLLFISKCNAFFTKLNSIRNNELMSNKPSFIWNELSNNFKGTARKWFIERAEKKGIKWNSMYDNYKNNSNELNKIFYEIENKTVSYPEYYTLPFHGYDNGNLNWEAAMEGEAATLSMAVNYWKNVDPETTENWLRFNISNNIDNYIKKYNVNSPKNILDVGCSIGISTEYLYNHFSYAKNIYGLDLSPYFISLATYRANMLNLPLYYFHGNAEETNFEENFYDLIVCNFIFHETPEDITKIILNHLHKLLKPNGVLAVVDLNPDRVQNNLIVSTFRKWAFEVTEPHIYEYYNTNMTQLLINTNLTNVEKIKNDPINSIWIGRKTPQIIGE